jgi:predicted RNA-binding protein YlqC (UPF0109 family)
MQDTFEAPSLETTDAPEITQGEGPAVWQLRLYALETGRAVGKRGRISRSVRESFAKEKPSVQQKYLKA